MTAPSPAKEAASRLAREISATIGDTPMVALRRAKPGLGIVAHGPIHVDDDDVETAGRVQHLEPAAPVGCLLDRVARGEESADTEPDGGLAIDHQAASIQIEFSHLAPSWSRPSGTKRMQPARGRSAPS